MDSSIYFNQPRAPEFAIDIFDTYEEKIVESEYPEDIETGNPEAEMSEESRMKLVKEKVGNFIKKYGMDLRVYDGGLEIITNAAGLFNLSEQKAMTLELQKLLKLVQGGKGIKDGQAVFKLDTYLNGTDKEASDFARSYFTIAGFVTAASTYISYAIKFGELTELSGVSKVCDEIVTPLFQTSIVQPLKFFFKFSNFQAANSMPENTVEEKLLKHQIQLKSNMELATSTIKIGLDFASFAMPQLAASPVVAVPMTVAALTLAIVNAYLLYNELQAQKPAAN